LASFRKNFGKYYADIWQIFCQKLLGNLAFFIFFGHIFCTWQTFSIFLAKFWHIFEKKEGIGRLLKFSFCFSPEMGDKFWRKT